jgi:cysteine dioxygenase
LDINSNITFTITSINELVDALSEAERATFNEIIHSTNLPNSIFENYCSWSTESYTRNCIIDNEKFELILICWESGQITPIHNHGGEECWVKVIEGSLKETIYEIDKAGELNILKTDISRAQDVSYMIDFMGYHSLENLSNKRSMSLHLYAKPIRSCEIFDKETRTFVNKKMSYNTIAPLARSQK